MTSIEVNTFPAPPSATVFEYTWNLDVTDASNAIASFQSFVQTDIPSEFGAEIDLGRGSSSGYLSFQLVGGWYGAHDDLSSVLAPLLAQLPPNPQVQLTPGTYINSVAYLAGSGGLDTSNPDTPDTFYAKSLLTPASSPMSSAAINAFISYLANQGYTSDTVSHKEMFIGSIDLLIIMNDGLCLY